MTTDPLWDDRPTTGDDPHRRPGESEAEHVHRTIANLRQTLNAKKIPPGSRRTVAHSEPVTTAPPAEPTSTARTPRPPADPTDGG